MAAALHGPTLDCGGRPLSLNRPRVMGVLNVTPDSFSDGGAFLGRDQAIRHAVEMVGDGADIIDVGGESSRPGADPVPLEEELERVIPVVEALRGELDCPISVDTYKPEVAREAVAAGAGLINDIRALQEPGAVQAIAELGVAVCLMHMQGRPRTMQEAPAYDDVVEEVAGFLDERRRAALDGGVAAERIVLDPGFGFGKTVEHNYAILRSLPRLTALGAPILVGMSRKSMVGKVTGRGAGERLAGSVAAASLAVWQGAQIVRAHDVGATVDAIRVVQAARG